MGKTPAEKRLKKGMKLEKKRLKLGESAGAVPAEAGKGKTEWAKSPAIKSLASATLAALIFAVFLFALNTQVQSVATAFAAIWIGVAGLAYKLFSEKQG